jgi:radical SAM protein with 4Fe4S-binding SPASM domain
VTNGSLLNKAKLAELKQLGLDSIAVSLDGSSYDVYSRIRKVDEPVYQKALETILAAAELGFYVKVNTTVFDSNYRDVPDITQFCISNGIDEHGLYYFTPVGRGARGQELAIEPLEWLSFIRKNLVSLDSKIKISLEVPLIEKEALAGKEIGCIANAERYHLQILPDGNVYPCAILASYRKPIANLHSKSVKQIWQNSKLWDEYWKKLLSTFTCGYCVDFNAFNIEDYDMDKYKFVCPLRKFRPSELK